MSTGTCSLMSTGTCRLMSTGTCSFHRRHHCVPDCHMKDRDLTSVLFGRDKSVMGSKGRSSKNMRDRNKEDQG